MAEKLLFTDKVKGLFEKAIDEKDYSEVKRLYNAVLEPVSVKSYTDESKFLEDLEWDLSSKQEMLSFLLNAPMDVVLTSLK